MDLGMIGLGRMGGPMSQRLLRGGHRVVGFARHMDTLKHLEEKGIATASSLDDLTANLKSAARCLADDSGRRGCR